MSDSFEQLVSCPRTGLRCPFLFEYVTAGQEALAKIDESQMKILGTASTLAVHNQEIQLIAESADSGHIPELLRVRAGLLGDAIDAEEVYEAKLLEVIEANEKLTEIYNKGARSARNTCIGGPLLMRQKLVTGEKDIRCASLFAITLEIVGKD